MNLVLLAQSLTEICEHSLVAPGRSLNCTILVNPAAGGYKIRSKWKAHVDVFNEYREKALVNPKRTIFKHINMTISDGKGSGTKTAQTVIERAEKNPDPFYLIISAGGDGTHGEVMMAFYNAPAHIRSNIAILRLPMGTGNDGADSASLAEALDLMLKPTRVEFMPAVQLVTAPGGPSCGKTRDKYQAPLLAFNILSIGLDAYVTHMTNKTKGKLPGDSYKLWVDIAALFYDCAYKVREIDVKLFDKDSKEIASLKEKMLLMAMGASGNRTYGSQQKILPDEHNVCGIKQMSVFRKLAVKKLVEKGTHTNAPETVFYSAQRIEITGNNPVLAQMDGETILLQPADFPAVMELTAPVIPVLKRI